MMKIVFFDWFSVAYFEFGLFPCSLAGWDDQFHPVSDSQSWIKVQPTGLVTQHSTHPSLGFVHPLIFPLTRLKVSCVILLLMLLVLRGSWYIGTHRLPDPGSQRLLPKSRQQSHTGVRDCADQRPCCLPCCPRWHRPRQQALRQQPSAHSEVGDFRKRFLHFWGGVWWVYSEFCSGHFPFWAGDVDYWEGDDLVKQENKLTKIAWNIQPELSPPIIFLQFFPQFFPPTDQFPSLLGPSMKLKRQTVAEKYQNEIEAFYKDWSWIALAPSGEEILPVSFVKP